MTVHIEKHNRHAPQQATTNGAYYENAIGFWGTVKAINSQLNTVDVESNRG